jgi:hypothetical protein
VRIGRDGTKAGHGNPVYVDSPTSCVEGEESPREALGSEGGDPRADGPARRRVSTEGQHQESCLRNVRRAVVSSDVKTPRTRIERCKVEGGEAKANEASSVVREALKVRLIQRGSRADHVRRPCRVREPLKGAR